MGKTDTRALDTPPPIVRVGHICPEELERIRVRTKVLVGHMKRLVVPHQQLEEDMGSLILWAHARIKHEGTK